MDARLTEWLDRQEIADLLARYARGVDRRDWPAVRAVFHADAHDDHGEYKGGVDGFIAWVTRRHAEVAQSMHFLGNCLIEFAGDGVAVVETYFLALQRLDAGAGDAARSMIAGGGGGVDMTVLGRYIDRLERRGGPWLVARRVVAFDAIRTAPADGPALKPDWVPARRDLDDPIYRMRAEAGLPAA